MPRHSMMGVYPRRKNALDHHPASPKDERALSPRSQMPSATPIGAWLKASNTVQPKTALSPRSHMPLATLRGAWLKASNTVQPKTARSPRSQMPLAMLIEAWLKACNKVQPERWPFRLLEKAKGHHGQMSGRCPRICSLKSHKEPYRVA